MIAIRSAVNRVDPSIANEMGSAHVLADELKWIGRQGPDSSAIGHVKKFLARLPTLWRAAGPCEHETALAVPVSIAPSAATSDPD